MKHYTEYNGVKGKIIGKRKKYDNDIYTFDIETTSYIVLDGNIYKGIDYKDFSKEEQEKCVCKSCMYIWMFSINEDVYYGRTWEEFKKFLKWLNEDIPEKKYVFVHNLSFEFQYLKSVIKIDSVQARKKRKVMTATCKDFNIEFRCSYMMSNCKLAKLPELFNLPVEKKVGDLDYTLIRTSDTILTDEEMGYCKNDCLVVYHYIKYELETYEDVKHIPVTSTGHVRRELKELVQKDFKYKRKVYKAINTDPHIYNLLLESFQGGYTHSNWIYTDELIKCVDSWDFTSSYPYVMVTHKFPSSEFKKCIIKSINDMSKRFAYLLVVEFKDVEALYNNTFISASKCRNIRGAMYDNGRIIKASEFEMTLTDVDFKLLSKTYKFKYKIKESYYSVYNYLPIQFINFILDKYVIKTQYKGMEEKKMEYNKEKSKFNSLYGMSVTNTIRDEVEFINNEWVEIPLTNEEIKDRLIKEKKISFLSFAYGVWITAYARSNLINNIIKLDDYVVYCDTDSIKVLDGYDKSVIDSYNESVKEKIKKVSEELNIPIERFAPKDIYGVSHMLGVFDDDGHYLEFITQGAKKYAYKYIDKKGEEKIGITVAGVPKSGAKALKDLNDFKDDFVFRYEDTNKNLLVYIDEEEEFDLTDYQGHITHVIDKSGCCLLPTTYVLGKALEYAKLLDDSSNRAIYDERR